MQTLITQLAKEKSETKNKEHQRRLREQNLKVDAINHERMRKDGTRRCGQMEDRDMLYNKMRDDADYLSAEVARKVEFARNLRSMNERNL